ncbi:MAG: hypothetical protein HGB05_02865 [Chloroflexi bacterium]|nr:hypothetical protein [Chloroflexota bacterium]
MPAKTTSPDFQPVFGELKKLLQPFAGTLKPHSKAGDYQLIGPPTPRSQGREVWFGAVQIKKNYVSYHLMAVYAFPDLLDGVSPELKKRMQGKSCFNFKTVDKALLKELGTLTKKGYQRFKKEGLV